MPPGRLLLFLTDQNVPEAIGRTLTGRGHDVRRVRDEMSADAADPEVAEAAMQSSRILVSWDKDFFAQRFQKPRFARLVRIGMSGPEPLGARRLDEVMDLLEFCFERAAGRAILVRIDQTRFMVREPKD